MVAVRIRKYKNLLFFALLFAGVLSISTIFYSNHYQIMNTGTRSDVNTGFSYSNANSSKYVIYICDGKNSCGGYGDRQKGIVASYIISVMMNRQFGVIMNDSCDIKQMFKPNQINWIVDNNDIKSKTSKRIKALDGYSDKLRKSMIEMDLDQEYKEEVIYFSLNLEFVFYLRQNKRYEKQLKWLEHLSMSEIYNVVWQSIFKLRPYIREKLDPFLDLKKQGLKLISAQIRLGKNPTIPHDSRVVNSLNNMNVLWQFYKKYNDSSKYRIFISTDSDTVREKARSIFPDVYSDVPGKVFHVERSNKTDICNGWRKVILDQVILSLSDVLVISNSGFGRIAAFFRQNENDLYCLNLDKIRRCTTQSEIFVDKTW
ncbi:hypothetical protein LOTGIDRAFT_167022 [Lottia gigantea]|uniref:GT23 domain-containing protein n=1 Tax=Lottia gigantea TaxID=225164 RepID=V4BDF4_LOTGI|nr:hypothetical protein LOTGIDRAFT_167022 [Lottia gigantea]ESO86504.1 hypothetical protein LOTGIDRAFT_167022 [Lottia gigantea]